MFPLSFQKKRKRNANYLCLWRPRYANLGQWNNQWNKDHNTIWNMSCMIVTRDCSDSYTGHHGIVQSSTTLIAVFLLITGFPIFLGATKFYFSLKFRNKKPWDFFLRFPYLCQFISATTENRQRVYRGIPQNEITSNSEPILLVTGFPIFLGAAKFYFSLKSRNKKPWDFFLRFPYLCQFISAATENRQRVYRGIP